MEFIEVTIEARVGAVERKRVAFVND